RKQPIPRAIDRSSGKTEIIENRANNPRTRVSLTIHLPSQGIANAEARPFSEPRCGRLINKILHLKLLCRAKIRDIESERFANVDGLSFSKYSHRVSAPVCGTLCL